MQEKERKKKKSHNKLINIYTISPTTKFSLIEGVGGEIEHISTIKKRKIEFPL